MEIQENVPLAPLTTFKIGGPARFFAQVSSVEEVQEALLFASSHVVPVFVLGGGSNLLISDQGFPGLVLHPATMGMEVYEEDASTVLIDVAAAQPWDALVAWAVDHGYWGVENLSHIPGSCGAFAVQNVGAYGAEASQVVDSVQAYDTQSAMVVTVQGKDCGFEYRRSIFNSTERGRYVILSTRLRLSKVPKPNLAYADLEKVFAGRDPDTIGLREIRAAVVGIREGKFPFPKEAKNGSAGSFFKAVMVRAEEVETLEAILTREALFDALERLRRFAQRRDGQGRVKLPTALLIDAFGLKGLRYGGALLNPTQPVVILNDGTATAADVLGLFHAVRVAVHERCGLMVEKEPELIGFSSEELQAAYSL